MTGIGCGTIANSLCVNQCSPSHDFQKKGVTAESIWHFHSAITASTKREVVYLWNWYPKWGRPVAYVVVCSETQIQEGRPMKKAMWWFAALALPAVCSHVIVFRQITPSCLPTFSKAAKTLSNCSSVWVAM